MSVTRHKVSNDIFFSMPLIYVFFCQHKDINKFQNQLDEDFCNTCDWFVDNKQSMNFGEVETKLIFFGSKFKRKNIKKLHIKYGDIQIKQHSNVNRMHIG